MDTAVVPDSRRAVPEGMYGNIMNMELAAMEFLRWQKSCPIVIRERCPKPMCGEPDVLGITKARFMLEIEIKRSVSDFRAEKNKPYIRSREFYLKHQPKQKWYFVDRDIAVKCLTECPEWAGMMTWHETFYHTITVLKPAPVNNESTRLSLRQAVKLAHMMSNHILSVEKARNSMICSFVRGHDNYYTSQYDELSYDI